MFGRLKKLFKFKVEIGVKIPKYMRCVECSSVLPFEMGVPCTECGKYAWKSLSDYEIGVIDSKVGE